MKRALSILLLSSLLLPSCAAGWHEEDKTAYLSQCRAQNGGLYASEAQVDDYCACNLAAVMKRYPTIEEVVLNKDSAAMRKDLENCSLAAQRK